MSKTLSIITPLYNSAQWLEKCLLSILDQDIPKEQMEIICINDGSPDNSADMARAIGERLEVRGEYNPIIVLDQENQGPSGARNTGMKAATGKYLMFVDPDDYVEPNTFGGLVKQMEDDDLDMLRFNFRRVDEMGKELPILAEDAMFDYTHEQMTGAEFLAKRLGIGCNIWRYIYRTEIITKNEIWCFTGDYFDDTPWLPLVLMQAKSIDCVDTIVYDYLERADGLVRAQSPKAIARKTEGQFLLLKYLKQEMDGINNEGVLGWYKNMIAHSVVSLLTMTAVYNFRLRKEYICRLTELNVFPLCTQRMTSKGLQKVKWINVNPMLFVWLVKIKNLIYVG